MDALRALQAFEDIRILAKPHMLIADHERYVAAYQFVRRLAAEVAEWRGRETWRPIESAPKDGRILLLSYVNRAGKRRTIRASWEDEDAIGEWENGDLCDPGWYERSEAHEDATEMIYTVSETPTHWRPLPEPPVAETKESA